MKPITEVPKIKIHFTRPALSQMPTVKKSNEAEQVFRQCFDPHQIDVKEFFYVMFTTNSNHVLGVAELGSGNDKGVCINVKEIFQIALQTVATGFILCHNHPSGGLKPSEQDKALTKKVKTFGDMIGIALLDHIIITSEDYYSMNDHHEI